MKKSIVEKKMLKNIMNSPSVLNSVNYTVNLFVVVQLIKKHNTLSGMFFFFVHKQS